MEYLIDIRGQEVKSYYEQPITHDFTGGYYLGSRLQRISQSNSVKLANFANGLSRQFKELNHD